MEVDDSCAESEKATGTCQSMQVQGGGSTVQLPSAQHLYPCYPQLTPVDIVLDGQEVEENSGFKAAMQSQAAMHKTNMQCKQDAMQNRMHC